MPIFLLCCFYISVLSCFSTCFLLHSDLFWITCVFFVVVVVLCCRLLQQLSFPSRHNMWRKLAEWPRLTSSLPFTAPLPHVTLAAVASALQHLSASVHVGACDSTPCMWTPLASNQQILLEQTHVNVESDLHAWSFKSCCRGQVIVLNLISGNLHSFFPIVWFILEYNDIITWKGAGFINEKSCVMSPSCLITPLFPLRGLIQSHTRLSFNYELFLTYLR